MAVNSSNTPNNVPNNIPTVSSGKLTTKIIIKNDYIRADGTCALYLQMFLNGKRKRVNLDIYVPEDAFDKLKMRIKKSFKRSKDLNLIIEKALADVNHIEVMHRLAENYLTVDIVAKELKSPSSRLDFISFWAEQIDIDAKYLSDATVKSAKSVLAKVIEFKPVILFRDLSVELINDLLQFLKTKKGNSQNTLFNVTKYIRKYIRRADRIGINIPIRYNEIPHQKVKAEIGHLSKEEIRKLWEFYNEKYVPEIYRNILAKFIFSCLTGLRISDMLALDNSNFIDDYLIKFVSKKSKKIQKIKLNDTAKKIIKDNYLFCEPYKEQTINRKLKEIAKLCKIPKKLHFHMARHSFATNFLKQGGRIEVLQRLLAHSSIRDTMNYVHVVDDDLNKEIYLLDNLFTDEIKTESEEENQYDYDFNTDD